MTLYVLSRHLYTPNSSAATYLSRSRLSAFRASRFYCRTDLVLIRSIPSTSQTWGQVDCLSRKRTQEMRLICGMFTSQMYEGKSKIIRTFVFPIYLHKSRGWTSTSFFYIVSFLFDALGPAVHKLAYSLHEEVGFRLVAKPFMHRFPPPRLVRIAGFRLLASKSL
jgi:hypothetical protein